MTDEPIIEKAINEIAEKEFGITKQLLEIHEVIYENDKPKVLRVDRESNDGVSIVYFPIKNEKFYLAIYVDTLPDLLVRQVATESYNALYFSAVSDSLTYEQLAQMTHLKATKGWSKGDKKEDTLWPFSKLVLELNDEPDEFIDKLRKLLDYLESDKEGIIKLTENTNACIQVVQEFHNSNTMLGGSFIDKNSIQRIANLNLQIDFDLYVGGNFYTS